MASQAHGASTISRRGFVQTAAVAAAGVTGSLAGPARGAAWRGGRDDHRRAAVPPTPIPGGIQIPDGPLIHLWVPGDPSVTLPFSGTTLMGFDVEPSTFTDRRGFTAVAAQAGTATGSDGATYNLEADVRAYSGAYVAADGTRRFGSFAFI